MKIIVAATPDVAIPTLEWLQDSEHELLSVITQPDRPSGRGQSVRETEVSTWAARNGVSCVKPDSIEQTARWIEGSDVLLTIGYGVLLPERILHIPKYGCLNLHFSLLPRWRGAAPVQRAIEAGDQVSGVTVFQLDTGMDTGPIHSTKRFALDSDITSDELFVELAHVGVEAVHDSLKAIEAGVRPIPQPNEGATRARKILKEECEIDWSLDAHEISRKIRAFTSKPGAWTRFRGQVVKIDSIQVTEQKLPAGEIAAFQKKLLVGTGSQALRIDFITPAGKSRMDSASWLNGARLVSGECFG